MNTIEWIGLIAAILGLLVGLIGTIVYYSNQVQRLDLENDYRIKENEELKNTIERLEKDFHQHETHQRESIEKIFHSISGIEKSFGELISFFKGSGILQKDF